MLHKNKISNYAKGGDERVIEVVGRSSFITLIIGIGIFFAEMIIKMLISKNLTSIIWEAVLLLFMIFLFIAIHLLNKIPMKKQ